MFDVVFGSDEYPEDVDSYVDAAAVFVNGENVAHFSGGRPLSVISDNISAGAFVDNQGGGLQTEYDGISRKLTISAPVVQGQNVVKIAVADTGDSSLDSGMFVSNLRAGGFSSAGAKVFVSAGAQKNDDNVLVSSGVDLDEFFDAGAGNDHVDGGGGDDILDLGDGNDVGIGGAGNDEVFGGDGNDKLVAGDGSGDDVYDGGAGIDTIIFTSAMKSIVVNLEAGFANGDEIGTDDLTGIEHVIGGSGADKIIGDGADNLLRAGDGDDRLVGKVGDDRLFGNAGDDRQLGGGGDDVLRGGPGNDVLAGGPGADRLFGGGDNDVLRGGGGVDVLRGGAGKDKLLGGPGADKLIGGGDNDRLMGGGGDDVLRGGGGNDVLKGGPGNDRLMGGAGNDKLIGGPGKEVLIGGWGADKFVYRKIEHIGNGADRDVIRGFDPGQDVLNLSAIDANTLVGGNQDFAFIGAASFSGAGQLRYVSGVLSGDVDGDGAADFQLNFANSASLSGADIVL